MKKSIFAVLAVAAMGASHAHDHDASSVSLYGVIDEGYLSKKTSDSIMVGKKSLKESISTSSFKPGNTSTTFIGIRSKENLGNGLDAKATIEFGFIDPHGEDYTGESDVAIRQAHVGLYSNVFGNLTIGRLHTKTYDFLGSEGLGSGTLPGTVLYNRETTFDRINGIRYSIGNELVAGYVSYGQYNQKTNGNSFGYHQYELAVEGKYQGAFGKVALLKSKNDNSSPTYTQDTTQTILGTVGYDFGIIKPSYTYLNRKSNDNDNDDDVTYHQLGFTAPVGKAVNLFGSYAIGSGSGKSAKYKDVDAKLDPANGWQVGATYHLSKRTNLYAAYGEQNHDVKINSNGNEVANMSFKEKAYTIGLKHMF